MADVVIAGRGPTGMMLAGELALGGVDVVIVERRRTPELAGSRAGGIHSRTIEILDQRGIADRFLAAGRTAQTARFGTTTLDISDFPTRHPYGLGIWQSHLEPLLAAWLDELGVPVSYGSEVVGFTQDGDGVTVELADGETIRAQYLVAADGGRSAIRKLSGIAFPGSAATVSNLIAEVELTEVPPTGIRQDESGVHGLTLLEDGRTYRVITTERELGGADEPSLADLSTALRAVFGTDFGAHHPIWISRFTNATRQASSYRSGRVILAGDAAHIHYPAGGQGIGLGIQDAVNLGWKLAQVVHRTSPDTLLETYQSERHPADARALAHSMAQTVLQRQDAWTTTLIQTVDGLMAMDEPRVQIGALIHGLDVAYDLGPGHPLLGRRMPDLDLMTSGRPVRVFELLHGAEPVLLSFAEPAGLLDGGRSKRIRTVDARYDGVWRLPVIGEVPPPSGVLVRPDGHVAWVGEGGSVSGLDEALASWFGGGD